MKKKKGTVYIISGPSGVGKTTIRRNVMKCNKNVVFSVSYTTRSPRKGERDGRDYFFITEEKFREMASQKKFAEWAKVFGNYYGTLKRFLDSGLKSGKDVLLEIDVNGMKRIKREYSDSVGIFILPPSASNLKRRLQKRGTDKLRSINNRLRRSRREIREIRHYDYFAVNDNLTECVSSIIAIMKAETLKVKRV